MMILFALLLAMGFPLVGTQRPPGWTFSLICHSCSYINEFSCPETYVCPYETRRCMTIAIRLNSRELLIYKNCTFNCTFVYQAEQPPPTPKQAPEPNAFYFVRCCSGMRCNAGGPTNIERDIILDSPIEEELQEGTVRGEAAFFLTFASIIVSNTLT
ncbi:glycosyl-phosphatidylinositol-anchored molecule-like protein [Tamandua tetradactyla]|uniref:glycosyl-phosphatidylinositol-anchored molecule-like protein n=1 Tax=Tamandua tetradactyla TaxID=48850 RepID=UPI00405399DA